MGKVITPFLFIVVAVGLFFSYLDPGYKALQALQVQESRLDEVLTGSKSLQEKRQALLARYSAFSDQDIARLLKVLPDNVDNVRLIIDVDGVAARHNLTLSSFNFSQPARAQTGSGPAEDELGTVQLSLIVSGSYADIKSFLYDLESSLRLLELQSLSVSKAQVVEGETTSKISATVSMRTYWLQ